MGLDKEVITFIIDFFDEVEFRDFLNTLDVKLKAKIEVQLMNIEVSGHFPSVDHLKDEIYEFRFKQGSNIVRVLWAFNQERRSILVITHGFVKKSQKTPRREINQAQSKLKLYYQKGEKNEK